jgi:hypothetical protein
VIDVEIWDLLSDWLTHQHRDTLASIVGHPTLTSFLAIADGEATGRVKFEMTEVRDFSSLYVCLSDRESLIADAPTLRSPATQRRGLEQLIDRLWWFSDLLIPLLEIKVFKVL